MHSASENYEKPSKIVTHFQVKKSQNMSPQIASKFTTMHVGKMDFIFLLRSKVFGPYFLRNLDFGKILTKFWAKIITLMKEYSITKKHMVLSFGTNKLHCIVDRLSY